MKYTLETFYKSREWEAFRKLVITQRTQPDGFIYDEITHQPILKPYDLILHHIEELTEENVNDVTVSLNPDNIMIVSFGTHNRLHDRTGMKRRRVYLVYGAPCAGKRTWVEQNKSDGDLIVDIDSIWECVSGEKRYTHPDRLKQVVFRLRDAALDAVKYRAGKWRTCYIIGGYPLQSERDRLARELNAEQIFIDATEEECLERLRADERRDTKEFSEYIRTWFERAN